MIIGEIGGQETSQMPLAEDDHVVQTLAPDGSDQSLRIRILPRAGRTGDNLADPHVRDSAPEHVAVDGVAIAQQPPRRVLWKGFNHLLRRPHTALPRADSPGPSCGRAFAPRDPCWDAPDVSVSSVAPTDDGAIGGAPAPRCRAGRRSRRCATPASPWRGGSKGLGLSCGA